MSLMYESDLIGLEQWLAQYTTLEKTPERVAIARRMRKLLDGVRGYHKGLTDVMRHLYIVLQVSHRGEFRVSEEKLIEFGLAGEIKSELFFNTDELSGDTIISVPSDQRRAYTDDDDAPFVWIDINTQILEDIFPDEPTLPGGKWSL